MQQQQAQGFEGPAAGFNPGAAAGSAAPLAPGDSWLQFAPQVQADRLMPPPPRSVPVSPVRPFSPQLVPQQQQPSPSVLLGHVQAQPNQAALPVYGPQQLALASLQQQQHLAQQEQQQLLGLTTQHSPAVSQPTLYPGAVLPQQQALPWHDSGTLHGLPLQQGQLLQQVQQAAVQLQQQPQMLLLQAQQQAQQMPPVLQLQPLGQHTPVLQPQQLHMQLQPSPLMDHHHQQVQQQQEFGQGSAEQQQPHSQFMPYWQPQQQQPPP